jgi:hypothetical protein
LKLKIFTFQFSESAKGFDDKPLQEFIADKEVIEFSEHFFIHENTPYLACAKVLTLCPARRLLVGRKARRLPPGTLRHVV